ncbi:uncharacterized protein Bfra_006562 [Botrytis fragariae]|uniref:Uncharacterized protein n=1 Tax=Botrytis fragariae TaxID=1964551 RepID=A0A8H6B4N2_9HELO|nr:uncharacterized protein Bfra_006562 [Botrytis fragariae]KAF5879353.1 hypothetical protein Bfra_006562 [Botrytis fragariae]
MSYTNQKVSSPVLGQRNFAYARNYFPARSPILGGRDSSEDGLDDVSGTDSTTQHHGMSRGNATGRSWPWQPPHTSRKPLTAMARPAPERQLSSSPEFTPASPAFATAGLTNQHSPEFAPRSPSFNPSSSGPSNALYAHYQPQPQSPAPGPSFLPDYQSPGMNYREHFTSYRARPQNSFATQPQPMLPSVADGLLRHMGNMNNSKFSWTHSKGSSRKRPLEEDDDFFAPPSKRREYSATQMFGLHHETTPRAAGQTLNNARNRVYASRNHSITPVEEDVEMNNCRPPASSNPFAGMVYEAAPSTPRGLAANEYNRPRASFPCGIQYVTTETAFGSNYSGEPGLVIQQKPIVAPARGASSLNTAVATEQAHRNGISVVSSPSQTSPQLPSFGSLFTRPSHDQYPQVSSDTSNNDYPMEPQNNVNNYTNLFSPSPQRSIRAEVFHSLEAHHGSVDTNTVDHLILHSYAPSPALSEGSTHDTENQSSNENPRVASPQEKNPINRHETDSVTLAEDTPRLSIEATDNFDNESVVSHHSNNNIDDDNNNQFSILQDQVSDLGVELDEVYEEVQQHRIDFDDLKTQNIQRDTKLSTLSTDVEELKQEVLFQSNITSQLRSEVDTLNAEASEHKSRFEELIKLVVEVTERSNLHGEKIKKLTQQDAGADDETANNNNNGNNVDEVVALKEEVERLQKEVLTLQNEALKKEIAELRASRGI